MLRATGDYAHLAIENPEESPLDRVHGLEPDSGDLLSRLQSTVAAEIEAAATEVGPEPLPLVLVSAMGDAFAGDELALVLARLLGADLNLIQLRGVIFPPNGARLARGILDALDVSVHVAVGADLSASLLMIDTSRTYSMSRYCTTCMSIDTNERARRIAT